MPPKPKFTREQIVAAALELVAERGMEALTARELGTRLGSSARPIFTVYGSMEEVQREVRTAAMKRFEAYAEKAMGYTPAFKQVGMQMILFAREEPKLYQLLFLSENDRVRDFSDLFDSLGELAGACLEMLQRDYGLGREEAQGLFRHVWVYTFGLGALCAAHACRFSEEEIVEMLGRDFAAMLELIRSGGLKRPTPVPAKTGVQESEKEKET